MSADDATRADCPQDAPVRVERDGPVTVVTLSRPHARNAVDGPTAHALARADVDRFGKRFADDLQRRADYGEVAARPGGLLPGLDRYRLFQANQ